MRELLEKVIEELSGAWRFRWWALGAAWAVCVAGWLFVFTMPDTYLARARVFVDTRTTLSQVTQGIAVDPNVDAQIQRVRQALLGGPQLEKVAREAGFDSAGQTPAQWQGTLASLRDRIVITSTSSRDTPTASTYNIDFEDPNRERSLRLLDRLVNTFVEGALGGKREGSAQAQQFLVQQIADYERRLSAAESRLADFKKQNFALMPGVQGDYFTRLQAETEGASKAESSLGLAQRRRDELQRQLRGEQPVLTSPANPGASMSAGATATGGNDTASRIRETQSRLDELLLRFTERHPDVLALRQTLDDLKARQQSEIDAMRRGDPGAAARLGLAANPVFQSIQLQFNQNEVEIAALRAELADRQRKITDLRRLLNTAPEIEAELARLNRDYDVTRAQYQGLVERLERTRISEDAEATGVVNFEVIDPPSASFTPVSPNRPKLLGIVIVAGLGLGGALAYLLHQLKPVFSSSRQLTERTGLPVLGVVSMTWLDKYKAQERKGALVYAGAAALLLLTSMAVLALQGKATALMHSVLS